MPWGTQDSAQLMGGTGYQAEALVGPISKIMVVLLFMGRLLLAATAVLTGRDRPR